MTTEPMTSERTVRSTDVQRISFSFQMVIQIALTVATVVGSVAAVTSGLRSDVRDVLTRMDAQRELESVKARLQDERYKTLDETIKAMNRRIDLAQYDIQRMNETMKERNRR